MDEINFKEMVNTLSDAGYSYAEIADEVGCSRQYVWKIGQGMVADLNYRFGSALRRMWKRATTVAPR